VPVTSVSDEQKPKSISVEGHHLLKLVTGSGDPVPICGCEAVFTEKFGAKPIAVVPMNALFCRNFLLFMPLWLLSDSTSKISGLSNRLDLTVFVAWFHRPKGGKERTPRE
jgi:hypothetical protein